MSRLEQQSASRERQLHRPTTSSSSNESSLIPADPTHFFLRHSHNLVHRRIDKTNTSYGVNKKEIQTYSDMEWYEKVVLKMFHIYSQHFEFIQNLPPGSKIYLPGVGTGRDALFLAACSELEVIGSDYNPNMVARAKELFSPKNIEMLARVLHKITTSPDSVNQLPALLKPLADAIFLNDVMLPAAAVSLVNATEQIQMGMGINPESLTMSLNIGRMVQSMVESQLATVTDSIVARTSFIERSILNSGFPDQSVNFIAAMAVLQHLTKEEIELSLDDLIRILAPGGRLYFTLRLDQGDQHPTPRAVKINRHGHSGRVAKYQLEDRSHGRTFVDTVLDEDRPRYYACYSMKEAQALLKKIVDKFGGKIIGRIDKLPIDHFDPAKPAFIDLHLERVAA